MKKRIISFILVLVMLFSCLSLNIFAAESNAEQEGEGAAAAPMTEQELRALCQSYGIGKDGEINLTKDEIAESASSGYIFNNSDSEGEKDNTILGMTGSHHAVNTVIFIDVGGNSGKTFNSADDVQLYVYEEIERKTEGDNTYYRWANKIYWDEAHSDPCDFSYTVAEDGTKTFNDEKLQSYVNGTNKLVIKPIGYASYQAMKDTFSPDNVTAITSPKGEVFYNQITPVGEGKASIWNGYVTNSYTQKSFNPYKINGKNVYCENYETLKSEGMLGAPYAITFDIRHRDGIKTGNIISDVRTNSTKEYWVEKNTSKTYVSANLSVSINEDGALVVSGETLEKKLTAETWYQLTVYHTPRGLDGIKGTSDDNTFHVFLNGEPVIMNVEVGFTAGTNSRLDNAEFEYEGDKLSFYTDFLPMMVRLGQGAKAGIDLDNFRMYQGSFLECKHSWEYSHKHDLENMQNILIAECEWCGKVEVARVPATFDNYNLSKEEIAKASVLKTEFNTDIDSGLGINKQNRQTGRYYAFVDVNCDGEFNEDDIAFYVTDVVREVEATETEDAYITFAPKIYADSQATKELDLSYTVENGTRIFNNAALAEQVGKANFVYHTTTSTKYTAYEKFSPELLFDSFTYSPKANKVETVSNVVSQNLDGTFSWNGYTTNEYLYKSISPFSYKDGTISNYSEMKAAGYFGSSYAITFDIRYHHGTGAVGNFFDAMRSLTANFTSDSSNRVLPLYNLAISSSGELQYVAGKNAANSGFNFENNTWYQLTLYHTPLGPDGIRGNDDDNTYHILVNGKLVATNIQAVADTYTEWDYTYTVTEEDGSTKEVTDTINPALDFVISYFRFGQNKHGIDVDDFRLYRGNLIECSHVAIDGTSTVKDGKCTTCRAEIASYACNICKEDVKCSAHVISTGVAVASRSLTLSESVDMNLYLMLTGEIAKNTDAKIVLDGADGARHAEFALADLVPEADGTYKVTLPLRSIDMMCKVTAAVYASGEKVGATYTTTVADYLAAAYANADTTEKEKALIVATANYGAYAQKYFAGKNGNSAFLGACLPNTFKGCTDEVALAVPKASVTPSLNGPESILPEAFSLVLASTVKIRVYFTLREGYTTECPSDGNGAYYVTVDGILPTELDDGITVTINAVNGDESAECTLTISVNNCLVEIANTAADNDFVNLAKAIYLYGNAAKELTRAE